MHTIRRERLVKAGNIVRVGKLIGVDKAVADIVVFNPAVDRTAKVVLLLCPCQVAFFTEKVSFVAVPRGNFGQIDFDSLFVRGLGKQRVTVRQILHGNRGHLPFHADNIRVRDVVDADFDDDRFYACLIQYVS